MQTGAAARECGGTRLSIPRFLDPSIVEGQRSKRAVAFFLTFLLSTFDLPAAADP
ncbi:MAG: hypothetical protein J0M09_03735 [Xanthomonadales bacterium]|nr:hypothetical protein [Xanthomonadales bacterium]